MAHVSKKHPELPGCVARRVLWLLLTEPAKLKRLNEPTAQILTVKRVISRMVVQKKHPSFLLSQCKLMRNTITWRCDHTVHLPLLLLLLSWSLLVTSSHPLVSVFSVLSGHVAAISSFLWGSFQWLNTHSVTSDLLFSLTSLSCCWWRIMKLILFTKAPNVWCVWLITRRWKQPDTFKLSPNRTAAVCVAVCSVLFCRHLRQTHYTDNYKHTQQTRVCLLPPLHVKTKRRH